MGDGTELIQSFSLSLILSTLKKATGKVLNASVHPSIPYYVYIMSIRETFLAMRILCLAGCEPPALLFNKWHGKLFQGQNM